jgi:hypothetical protein
MSDVCLDILNKNFPVLYSDFVFLVFAIFSVSIVYCTLYFIETFYKFRTSNAIREDNAVINGITFQLK